MPLEPFEYEELCRRAGATDDELRHWVAAWDVLSRRPGWRLFRDEDDGEDGRPAGPAWEFGLDGAVRLAVTVDEVVIVYRAEADDEISLATAEDLLAWLDAHETEYEGFTKLQLELIDHVGPIVIDEWRNDMEHGDP